MTPRIHLVRHGQGFHQLEPLEESIHIHDPSLTALGVERCKGFNNHFPVYIPIDLVCASPLRRAIQTARYAFADVIPKTPTQKILLLPLAQETSALPSDTGSSPSSIIREFGDLVDVSLVEDEWTSKKGIYAPDSDALISRAQKLRQWLRERSEKEIVVVGHGSFWDYITGAIDKDGMLLNPESSWANREWRTYVFASEDDNDAVFVEEQESIVRRHVLQRSL